MNSLLRIFLQRPRILGTLSTLALVSVSHAQSTSFGPSRGAARSRGLSSTGRTRSDAAAGKVYWVAGDRMIRRSNLDGTQVEEVGSTGRYTYDLTIDPGAGRLYWTTPREIGSVNVDGTDPQNLITTPTTEPQQLFVDQENGKMYWIDGPGYAIQRANLNGSRIEDVVVTTSNPRSFTVGSQKIYWLWGTLRSTNLDGTGTEDIVGGLSQVTSLALNEDQGKLYWTTTDGVVKTRSMFLVM